MHPLLKPSASALVLVLMLASHALAGESPAPAVGWDAAALPDWSSPVPREALVVDGPTDIRWMPEAFAFTPGSSVRYIDFVGGDDSRDGLSRETAWKHHPWDPAAAGAVTAADGVHTYVFKRGVVYRGRVVGTKSGTTEQPVRLTSDPVWGAGEAVIAGSLGIAGGWKQMSAAESSAFPVVSHGRLWAVDLPGAQVPRGLWRMGTDGTRQRLTLARWPNWRIEHPYNHFTQWLRVERIDKGWPQTTIFAPKVLKDPDRNAYRGATVWMDHANTSNEFSIIGPFPAEAAGYDPAKGSLRILTNHPRRHPQPNAPFYLENLPRFLDEDGEWWFDAKASRLWLRLPEGEDPNKAVVEAAQHDVIIDLVGLSHVEVSGLTLIGGNCPDLNKSPGGGDWERRARISQMGAIRLKGSCSDIVLRHVAIRDTLGGGIVNDWTADGESLRDVVIRDCDLAAIDNDGICLSRTVAESNSPLGTITGVRIWRNRLRDVGLRCSHQQGGIGIGLRQVQVADIAGNIVERVGKQGIDVIGGGGEAPLVRILIRHNKVVDTLMQRQDFGGIEFWGTGPCYLYGNISINPVGFVAHRNLYHKNEAYYVDHGLKAYLFSNLGWSERRADSYKGVIGSHFIHEIRNRWNQAFHNTGCDFRAMQSHSMQHGDQQHYLGNLFINGGSHFSAWRLDQAREVVYANNLVAGTYERIFSRWQGESHRTMEQFGARLAGLDNHLSPSAGWVTDDMPVRDAAGRDFLPTDDSAAIDRGVRVFVPWSLAGTVGEWHFRQHRRDPQTVLGYDLFAQDFAPSTGDYQLPMTEDSRQAAAALPGNELEAPGFTVADYVDGPLEDWVPGAVRLDGKRQLSISHARLVADFQVPRGKESVTIPGTQRRTVRMGARDFLIEVVLRVDGPGVVAEQRAGGAGYALAIDAQGRPALTLALGGAEATATGRAALTDGRWHHLLAEVDRAAGRIRIFVDATEAGTAAISLAADASLDNTGDFVVGRGLIGALDYLRLAQSTLAGSGTSIGELMSWQFAGPPLRDFTGRLPVGTARDVGAIEHPTAVGRKTIRYTPPVIPPAELLKADDRRVEAAPWGAVSAPKAIVADRPFEVQVSFGTEAVAGSSRLSVELHGWAAGKALGVLASAPPVAVTAGVTIPYTVTLTAPVRAGLTGYTVRVVTSPDGKPGDGALTADVGVIPVAAP